MYQPTKFGVRSFIHSKVMDGVPNFKFSSRDPDHAHFMVQFFVHWLVHVMISACTKYEVYTFGHSKDIKGVPKSRKWSRDLSHAHLGVNQSINQCRFVARHKSLANRRRVNFHISTKGFRQRISPQNSECVTLSTRKLWRGSQILNVGHVTLTTPTLGVNFLCFGQYMSWSKCAPNMKFLPLVIPKI